MAKKIVDEQIKLSIVIDGDDGQNKLYDLEKSTRDLNAANKELLVEKTKLEKQGKKESEAYKLVTGTIKQNNQVIKENKARISELQNQIGLTGLTMAQLRTKANLLRTSLSHMVPGSTDYIRYDADLKKVTARMDELRGKAQATGMTLGSVADKFNRYAALATSVVVALTGIVLSIQQVLDYNGKLSDSQSDVMKTTGMTKKEVDGLTKSFGLFKTRTARIELLKLAEEGGRLGIEGVENIQKWVNVANQLKVALGDDLSETQIREVGKMVQVYRVGEETGRDFEGAMLSLGSAINEVSASGSNQAGFLVDFMKRTGGLSQIAKLSSADNLGYAATFDEIGQSAEVAGTVMNKLMTDMFAAPDQYAKIAKMNVGEFTQLLNTDFNAAMVAFLKGLDGNNAGLSLLSARMEDLDIGGARGSAAIAGLASNLHILEQRQNTSNFAMIEATSLTDEYNIKNENLASILDKIKQRVVGWYSSDTFIKWLTDAVTWFGKFIGATDDVDHSTTSFKNNIYFAGKLFTILVAGVFSYTAAMKIYTLWTTRGTQGTVLFNMHLRIQTALQKLAAVSTSLLTAKQTIAAMGTHLYAAAKLRLAGNTAAATAQMKLFKVAFMSTPWGLIIGLVAALTSAYFLFRDEVKKTNDVLIAKQKIESQASETTSKHKAQVNSLIEVIRSSTTTIEQKERALSQLHKITNGYLDTLNLENATTWQSINLIDNYIKHIDALARAKAAVSIKAKLYEEQEANEAKIRAKSAEKENTEEGSVFTRYNKDGNFLGVQFGRNKNHVQQEIDELKKNGESIKNQLGSVKDNQNRSIIYLQKSIENDKNKLVWLQKGTTAYINLATKIRMEEERLSAFLQTGSESPEVNSPTEPTGFTPITTPKKKSPKTDAEKAAEKEAEKQKRGHEKRLEEIEKFHEDKLKLAREYEDGNFELMTDGYAKEKQFLDKQSARKIEDLRAKLIKEEEIEKALTQSKNEKLTAEQQKSYADIAQAWKDSNAEIYRKIEQETDLHHIRLATLVEKYSVSELEKLKEKFDADKVNRETAFNLQLAALGTNERAKEKLKKQFDQAELDAEKIHLEKLVAVYNQMMAGGTVNGIDFSLLSNEDAAELQKNIDVINLAISELLAKKAALKNGGEEKGIDLSNGEKTLGLKQTDFLGFTKEQWDTFEENIKKGTIGIETMTMAISLMQNVWAEYDAMVSAGENRRLKQYETASNKKERRLKSQLDRGLINQDQYNKAVEAVEADMTRKKAEIEYKQAKRKRAMDMANVIVNTSLAIMQAYAQMGPIAGTIAAVLMGTVGAFQLATIRKQPLPSVSGYEKGLYGDHLVRREQDGKVFKTTYGGKTRSGVVNKNTMYMVGENGPEMVIDNKAFRKMNPQLRDSLIRELRGIKGFEHGYYNQRSMQVSIPEAGNLSNGELIAAIIQLNQLLTRIEQNGIPAYISNKDFGSMKNVRDGIKAFENFRNRNKIS